MTAPTLAAPRSGSVLPPGTRLGPYEIESLIGSGGMGHVYRAHDQRLGRRVAIKTLAESAAGTGSDGLRRFETEARAAGTLDHPNLLIVYDVGRDAGISYIVSELLDGETLRTRLGRQGALAEQQAIDYALQAARGLAAAHARGIVHRDLKPENLFITRDRGLKILDFGVAKLLPDSDLPQAQGDGPAMTGAGMLVGTVGYMAPEQVNGEPVDHRTDQFSLGVVLYEMLAGRAPFDRPTPVASMHAIASEEPAALPETVSPALAALVWRCLGKSRDERFASTNDLIVALDLLADAKRSTTLTPRRRIAGGMTRRQSLRLGATIAVSALAGLGAGAALQQLIAPDPLPPSFRRLTFRRGLIRSARFAPDGQTILYGALWDGEPCRVHAVRLDGPESRALDLPEANLLAVSPTGELALALGPHLAGIVTDGTLARVPMTGGVPRELTESVKFADWSPDGRELAVVRHVDGRDVLEYPAGRVLVDGTGSEGSGIGFARIAPDGQRVAYAQFRSPGSLYGRVCMVDRAGTISVLSDDYLNLHGLAWHGDTLWYTAADQQPLFRALCAVRPGRAPHTVARVPGNVTLWDISAQGRLVLAHTDDRGALFVQRRGEPAPRDLSWLDASALADLSRDGSLVLFTEDGQGGGAESSVYLRRTDGSAALRLGQGRALALSPDTRWALCIANHDGTRRLQLVPTGVGENRVLADSGMAIHTAHWLPDGKGYVLEAAAAGEPAQLLLGTLDAATPRPLVAAGVRSWALSPDGRQVAVRGREAGIRLYPLEGGERRSVAGDDIDRVVGWIDGGLLVMRPGDPAVRPGEVFLVDLDSGERRHWDNLLPLDGAGIMALLAYRVTPDGTTQAYAWHRALSNLYVAEGLA